MPEAAPLGACAGAVAAAVGACAETGATAAAGTGTAVALLALAVRAGKGSRPKVLGTGAPAVGGRVAAGTEVADAFEAGAGLDAVELSA